MSCRCGNLGAIRRMVLVSSLVLGSYLNWSQPLRNYWLCIFHVVYLHIFPSSDYSALPWQPWCWYIIRWCTLECWLGHYCSLQMMLFFVLCAFIVSPLFYLSFRLRRHSGGHSLPVSAISLWVKLQIKIWRASNHVAPWSNCTWVA